jgi:hypothetical protein
MKNLKIEFHKRKCDDGGGQVFMRTIQEVGVIEGFPPTHGAFFEPGFEDLFACVLDYESYLLYFMDHNFKYWDQSGPGLLCSMSFNENELIDEESFANKLVSADSDICLSDDFEGGSDE